MVKILHRLISAASLKRRFLSDYFIFKRNNNNSRGLQVRWQDRYPIVNEATSTTKFDPHYVYFPSWAARKLAVIKPKKHVDISSTLNFCSLVSAFIPVDFYDYRPANLNLSNLSSKSADLVKLPFKSNSIESLSCMHVIEHIGLGRYGDPINPDGDTIAAHELQRILAVGGNLLIVVPVGIPKIMFNAHRIYSYEQVLDMFSGLSLKEFSLIPDKAIKIGMIENSDPELVGQQKYACGCFWFTK